MKKYDWKKRVIELSHPEYMEEYLEMGYGKEDALELASKDFHGVSHEDETVVVQVQRELASAIREFKKVIETIDKLKKLPDNSIKYRTKNLLRYIKKFPSARQNQSNILLLAEAKRRGILLEK